MQSTNSSTLRFLLFAFGLTWMCWLPALLLGAPALYGEGLIAVLTQADLSWLTLPQVIFLLGAWGPFVAALLVQPAGTRRVWLVTVWRHWPWGGIVIAMTLAVLIAFVPWWAYRQLGAPTTAFPVTGVIVGLFALNLFTSGAGEEPGWRGYLLPKFQQRHGPRLGTAYLGLIWSFWHFPITVASVLTMTVDQPGIVVGVSVLVAFTLQTVSLVGMGFVMAWLMRLTKSVAALAIFHATANTAVIIFLSSTPEVQIRMLVSLSPCLFAWLLAHWPSAAKGGDPFQVALQEDAPCP